MTRISPSTLSVIAAALSVERDYQRMTHWEIEQALMKACGVSSVTPSSNDLSAGEFYLVIDNEDGRRNPPRGYSFKEGLENYIQDMLEEMETQDFDERFTTYIVRKEVKMRTERRVKVIFE